MRIALLVCATLGAGCATLRQPLGTHSWDDVCYQGLHADVDYLGGADAYDCGLLHLGAGDGALSQITACARDAVASGRPYRFGYQSIGSDSLVCAAAVRAPDGRLWLLDYDDDVGGKHSVLWVQRCGSITFSRHPWRPAIFFSFDHCEPIPDMFDTLQRQRASH